MSAIWKGKMKLSQLIPMRRLSWRMVGLLCWSAVSFRVARAQTPEEGAVILTRENVVESAHPSAPWRPATVGQKLIVHERLRTGEDSRATYRLSDSTIGRMDELAEAEILPPRQASDKPTVDVKQGTSFFFSREPSREMHVQTPAANGAIRGTEFVVRVGANGYSTFTMLDGEVEVSNAQGPVLIHSGEQAESAVGGVPHKTAVIEAINSIQWCLYYPGVFDPDQLGLSANEKAALANSLAAYRSGDLLAALP